MRILYHHKSVYTFIWTGIKLNIVRYKSIICKQILIFSPQQILKKVFCGKKYLTHFENKPLSNIHGECTFGCFMICEILHKTRNLGQNKSNVGKNLSHFGQILKSPKCVQIWINLILSYLSINQLKYDVIKNFFYPLKTDFFLQTTHLYLSHKLFWAKFHSDIARLYLMSKYDFEMLENQKIKIQLKQNDR